MMRPSFWIHNQFQTSLASFKENDPQLRALSELQYQYTPCWWQHFDVHEPGIYILTGGRQIGKSTSVKLFIAHCLTQKTLPAAAIFYLPCDEIFDARELSMVIRDFVTKQMNHFLLIIDEVTFVKEWDRVIKALADEGCFTRGVCLLTGSDTLILKEAAMRFPGRRGQAAQTDFHMYPLTFREYVQLLQPANPNPSDTVLALHFENYLQCGGYLRAINDIAQCGSIRSATYQTYQQWIRGDFLKKGKNETYLLGLLQVLILIGVSQISFSTITQKMGLIAKDTCIDYMHLLERMDVLFNLQAFDQNKHQGFPKKNRKFHFVDPFIYRALLQWLQEKGYANLIVSESTMIEACVASHCFRRRPAFYFKGQGEVDLIVLEQSHVQAIEVKWAEQIRPIDFKTLKQFDHALLLGKSPGTGMVDGVEVRSVYRFLFDNG